MKEKGKINGVSTIVASKRQTIFAEYRNNRFQFIYFHRPQLAIVWQSTGGSRDVFYPSRSNRAGEGALLPAVMVCFGKRFTCFGFFFTMRKVFLLAFFFPSVSSILGLCFVLRCASLNGACVIQKLTAFGLPELIRNRFLSDFSLLSLFLKRGTGRGRGEKLLC